MRSSNRHLIHGSCSSTESIGFMPRFLVLTSLPHSRQDSPCFERVNGNMRMVMVSASHLGLPFGTYPRRLLLAITTSAVRSRSPVVSLGSSMSSYLKSMGVSSTGGSNGTLRSFRDQARRLFGTFISIEVQGERNFKIENILPVQEANMWWEPQSLSADAVWEASITLGSEFYRQIIERPIPLDWRVINGLSQSPMAMDVYAWASYRRSQAKKSSKIPWSDIQAQFGSAYPMTPRGTSNFKSKFTGAACRVAEYDPEILRCLIAEEEHLLVKPGSPHVPRKDVAWG